MILLRFKKSLLIKVLMRGLKINIIFSKYYLNRNLWVTNKGFQFSKKPQKICFIENAVNKDFKICLGALIIRILTENC